MEINEIQKWRELAKNKNPNARKLALDLAPALASNIQNELILWFLANENFEIKKIIYNLLNEDSCNIVSKINEDKIPESLDKIEEIKLLNNTDDEALQKTILNEAIRKRTKEQYSPRLLQIKDYMEIKKCSLKEAIIAVGSI